MPINVFIHPSLAAHMWNDVFDFMFLIYANKRFHSFISGSSHVKWRDLVEVVDPGVLHSLDTFYGFSTGLKLSWPSYTGYPIAPEVTENPVRPQCEVKRHNLSHCRTAHVILILPACTVTAPTWLQSPWSAYMHLQCVPSPSFSASVSSHPTARGWCYFDVLCSFVRDSIVKCPKHLKDRRRRALSLLVIVLSFLSPPDGKRRRLSVLLIRRL